MKHSVTGYLEKYHGCMMHKENIALDEAFNIAWSNAQRGLHSVVESEVQTIYINCDLFNETTTSIEELIEE